MASLLERLAAKAEWIDDSIELLWWGKAYSGVAVGRESDSDFLKYYSRYMTDANGFPFRSSWLGIVSTRSSSSIWWRTAARRGCVGGGLRPCTV